jgi:hypothetical protein
VEDFCGEISTKKAYQLYMAVVGVWQPQGSSIMALRVFFEILQEFKSSFIIDTHMGKN